MAKPLTGLTGNEIVVLKLDDLRTVLGEAVQQTLAKCGPPAEGDIMNSRQCAELVKCHVYTLPKLIAQGLPTLRPVGHVRRFSRKAVLSWLASRE
jgi:hypothetical protein